MKYLLRFSLMVSMLSFASLDAVDAQVRGSETVARTAVAAGAKQDIPCPAQFSPDVWLIGDFAEFFHSERSFAYDNDFQHRRSARFACFGSSHADTRPPAAPYLPPAIDPRILLGSPRVGGVLVVPVGQYWIELD